MSKLDFIADVTLRGIIENSINYIWLLFEEAKKEERNQLYKEETRRVIILYTISIIEAVLLYLYKERGEEMIFSEYKHPHNLPREYNHKDNPDFGIVIAVRKNCKTPDHKIGLYNLVSFFEKKKIIKEDTAKKILEANEVRNTFHFHKPREKAVFDINKIEDTFKLLVYILENTPRFLKK